MILNLLNPVVSGAIDATISDEELIQKYLATQKTRYFNVLYDRYTNKVYAKCISMLKDETQAEDAVQEIFMKVLLSVSKFKQESKFSTWLYSVTYNYCIDLIRRRKKKQSKEIEVDDMGNLEGVPDDNNDSDILETHVAQMKIILDTLREDDKAVLLMKYMDDMSIKDMTDVLDQTESAVKMRIKRAKEKFRRQYALTYAS